MKKVCELWVVSLLLLCAGLSFSACSDDDDDDSSSDVIVGKWQSTYVEVWNKIDGVDDGEGYKGPFPAAIITFDNNKTVSITGADAIGDVFNGTGNYTLSGSTLTIEKSGMKSKLRVLELTDSKLVIEYSFQEDNLEGYLKLECKRVD